ncbi:MAG: hypothetical protein ACQETE_02610 [Bacteroidota bacterium]
MNESSGSQAPKTQPRLEELDFLDRRSEIEASLPDYMTTEQFLHRYQEIEKYGLTDQILKRVEGDVWYQSHYRLDEFIQGEFYSLFKHHWVIRKYLDPQYIESE